MIEVTKFSAKAPGVDGDMTTELTLRITNTAQDPVRLVTHTAVFLDEAGFPLHGEAWTAAEDCSLATGDSIDVSYSPGIVAPRSGVRGDRVRAQVTATLHAREFTNIGELDVPGADGAIATLERAVRSVVIEGPVRVLARRLAADSDGLIRIECCASFTNVSDQFLERVELRCELLDADGSPIESVSTCEEVAAGAVACIMGGSPWARHSTLKGAKLRLLLSVFRPIEVLQAAAMSDIGEAEDEDSGEDEGDDIVELDDADDEASDGMVDGDDEGDIQAESGDDGDEDDEEVGDDGDDEDHQEEDEEGVLDGLDPAVAAILRAAGATDFSDSFVENQITEDVLGELSDADLLAIGVTALGQRKRILGAIASRGAPSSPRGQSVPAVPPLARPATTDWARLIASIRGLFSDHSRVTVEPGPGVKQLSGAQVYAGQLEGGVRALLVYDDTMFGSGKDGLLATTKGVHWRNAFAATGFQPWDAIRSAAAKGKSVQLDPGGEIVVNFGGAKAAIALATFINSAAAAAAAAADDSHPQRDAIRAAISEMRKQSRNDFVVLDGPSSDQYVQFCNGDRGAVMDMPKRAGSGSMAERAAAFLDQHGFELTKYDEGETYLREFDPDEIEEMISIAIRAFRGIYALPPKTRLQIVRGWD